MTLAKALKRVTSGKWDYGPFASDHALDYAWELEYDLLKEADKQKDTDLAFVSLYLLTHIKNNSIDKSKKLYRELRGKMLKGMEKDAHHHSEPAVYIHEKMKILDELDTRILDSEFSDEEIDEKQRISNLFDQSKHPELKRQAKRADEEEPPA